MSDGVALVCIFAVFAIFSTCSNVGDIEREQKAQRVLLERTLQACAPPAPVVQEPEPEPEPIDPCACEPGQTCMCQGTP